MSCSQFFVLFFVHPKNDLIMWICESNCLFVDNQTSHLKTTKRQHIRDKLQHVFTRTSLNLESACTVACPLPAFSIIHCINSVKHFHSHILTVHFHLQLLPHQELPKYICISVYVKKKKKQQVINKSKAPLRGNGFLLQGKLTVSSTFSSTLDEIIDVHCPWKHSSYFYLYFLAS